MGSVNIKNTIFEDIAEVSEEQLAKIAAVTFLTVRLNTLMNIHEPKKSLIRVGVNQLYAEIGINPRDSVAST